MKKRKICIITGAHWAAAMGGAQYQAKCLVNELVKNKNIELFYLARMINPSYQPEEYKIMQIAKPGGLRRYGFFFDANQLTKHLKDIQPDVIYQRGLQAYTGIAARYAKRNSSRFVFHIASDCDVMPLKKQKIPMHSGFKRIDKSIGQYGLRHANDIIAQTEHQANLLTHYYGQNATAVIPNAHPFPEEKIDKKNNPRQVIWVGNFTPIKRPEMFVRLAAELRSYKEVEFIMVGRPGNKKLYGDLHAQIAELENLKYLGEEPLSVVNKILAEGHIFVNTSTVEGFPNTFIQAWMRNVPIVSTVNTDNILDREPVGIYGATYEDIKNSVIKLLENENIREDMGANALQYSFMHNSLDNIAKIVSIILV